MGQTGEKRRCWFESSRGSGEIYAYFYCNGRKHDPISCQLTVQEAQLRSEQDRITRGLASVSRELEQLSTDAPAHIKKIMSQAFFQNVLINPESGIETPGTAVNAVEQLNPYLSHVLAAPARHAGAQGQTCEEPPETGRLSDQGDSDEPIPANIAHVTGFRPVTMVELRGFEPLTFSLRTRRATNCAIAPCGRPI